MAYILRANLERALHVAIQAREKEGAGDSAEVAGWRQSLAELRHDGFIEVLRDPPFLRRIACGQVGTGAVPKVTHE